MAYRWAFLTLMLSLAVNTGVEAIWGPWAKPGVSAWMLIFLSIGVFIVACVRKDAYFAVAQNPRTYLWLFGAVVLCQIPNFLPYRALGPGGGRTADLERAVPGLRGAVRGDVRVHAGPSAPPEAGGAGGRGGMKNLRLKSARAAKDLSQRLTGGHGVRVPADHQRHRKGGL